MSTWTNYGILTQEEIDDFRATYTEVLENVQRRIDNEIDGAHLMEDSCRELMNYNVPHGKQFRGLLLYATYKCLAPNPSSEDMHLAAVSGWGLEISQGAGLMVDDILDGSDTRRGKPCWYTLPQVGVNAICDVLFLEQIIYLVMKIYFTEKPVYGDLVDILRDITLKTIIGEDLDLKIGNHEFSERYTMERYSTIVKYKTSYYTVYAPIIFAMHLAGKGQDKALVKLTTDLALDLGHYFQVQDDFLDCFGDPEVTGKIGTDIQDGKCTWLIVTALEMCDDKQRKVLEDNYGRADYNCVEIVKSLYREIGVPEAYEKFEDETYVRIEELVDGLPEDMPKLVFNAVLTFLYKRTK